MTEKKIIKLTQPIIWGSETISELHFREGKAKAFKDVPISGVTQGHLLDVAAKLCGQVPEMLYELSLEDYKKVMDYLGESMQAGQKIGD